VTKDVTVGKLFAKHIKLKDSISFLKSTRIGIGIGTPSRLSDLMKESMKDLLRFIYINANNLIHRSTSN
jgi:protein CMS1